MNQKSIKVMLLGILIILLGLFLRTFPKTDSQVSGLVIGAGGFLLGIIGFLRGLLYSD